MTFGSLFAGIGGLDLGLERAGLECRWQVELDDYCCKILSKHWPEVKKYGDIRNVTGNDLEPVDLICGGFPCQDLSQAGKQTGFHHADGTPTRSGLWFEYARLVRELRPRYVLAENVPGLLVRGALDRVIGELARCGYVGIWRCLRASQFGASHLRKRVFIIAVNVEYALDRGQQDGRPGGARPLPERKGDDLRYALAQPSGDVADRSGEGRQQIAGSAPRDEAADGRARRDLREPYGDYEPRGEGADVAHRNGERRREAGELRHGEIPLFGSISDELAHGTLRGLGELWQPSGGDGLTDRRDEELAHTENIDGRRQQQPGRTQGSEREDRWCRFTGSDSALADTRNRLLPQQGRGPERGDGPGSAGEILSEFCRIYSVCHNPNECDGGDSKHYGEYPAGCWLKRQGLEYPAGFEIDELADAERTGLEIGNGKREQQPHQDAEPLPAGLPTFAPGPADPRWPLILRERPDLAPALGHSVHASENIRSEASGSRGSVGEPSGRVASGARTQAAPALESQICRVADGIPTDLDRAMQDRTKRLGRLGNAVVPDCAEWLGRKILEFEARR